MSSRVWIVLPVLAVALPCASGGPAWAAPASKPAADAGKAKAPQAKEAFAAAAAAYMASNWDELLEAQKSVQRHLGQLTPQQRADLTYIRATVAEYRPPWWKACASTGKATIPIKIWGRGFTCNYTPADKPVVMVDPTRMMMDASWNPSYVDSTVAEEGKLAVDRHLTRGDFGEATVWRQLGMGYIMAMLPPEGLKAMARDNQLFYLHLQCFFAELTTMYHSSPRARQAVMVLHGTSIHEPAGNGEGYIRACRAISALLLSLALEDPKKWPSVRLPAVVPDEAIEKTVGELAYVSMSAGWTLEEDRAFREALKEFLRNNGERAVKQRGKLLLPNKLTFMLMEPDDRPFQEKRDAWMKDKMEKAGK